VSQGASYLFFVVPADAATHFRDGYRLGRYDEGF
jgi:hypothetical protein